VIIPLWTKFALVGSRFHINCQEKTLIFNGAKLSHKLFITSQTPSGKEDTGRKFIERELYPALAEYWPSSPIEQYQVFSVRNKLTVGIVLLL
jgi:hypothetical protein